MGETYSSQREADDDHAELEKLRVALNAARNSVRLDACRLWTIRGRGSNYISTWGDGKTWLIAISSTARGWGFIKKALASCCVVTQDGDEEGIFRLMRLPTEEEAISIRRYVGLRQTKDVPPEQGDALRAWRDEKTAKNGV